jgi:hypothetical protein
MVEDNEYVKGSPLPGGIPNPKIHKPLVVGSNPSAASFIWTSDKIIYRVIALAIIHGYSAALAIC